MIRILHVLGGLDRGGAEALVMNLYRNIDREEIQFDFVIHTTEHQAYYDEIVSMGGKIFHCPRYKGKNHFEYKKWWRNFFKENPQYRIIHSHIRSCASVFLPIAKKYGLKTIIHSHNTSNGKGISSVCKRFLQYPLRYQADYFFACSKVAGRWLFGGRVIEKSNFFILKNAIKIEDFRYNKELRKKIRNELGISDACFVVGTVGRLTPQKNPIKIIEICRELHKQTDREMKFLWVGSGEMYNEIKNQIEKNDLADFIIMMGSRSDVNAIFQAMDVFVFPSLWEGLGIVAIESQAAGLMTLCSEAVPADVAVSELCEFLPLYNVNIWVDKIMNSNQSRQDYSRQISNAGYNICNTVQWLQKFYDEILRK